SSESHLKDFWSAVDESASDFESVQTESKATALISLVGSQGKPNQIVHTHESFIKQLTCFEMLTNLDPGGNSIYWTPEDWSSPEVLLGFVYPVWWYGGSIVASSPDNAGDQLKLGKQIEVTHMFAGRAALASLAASRKASHEEHEFIPRSIITDQLAGAE